MDDPEKSSGSSESKQQAAVSPLISLPKGGSAIRGTGEKFAADPVTGTGSMSVPLVTSTGHSGFDPLGVVFTRYPTMSPNQKVEYHKAKYKEKTMEDIFKITLWLPDQQALNKVLASADAQLNCRAPKRESDGTYRVELYTSPAESKKIIDLGYRTEVDKTYGEVLAMRQKEVSKTDRFKGGKVKPTGLGERR